MARLDSFFERSFLAIVSHDVLRQRAVAAATAWASAAFFAWWFSNAMKQFLAMEEGWSLGAEGGLFGRALGGSPGRRVGKE